MKIPKISVVIAVYNGERYIRDQLNSILRQIDDSTEVIISDNGSIDNTIQIIKEFKDSRIKLYQNLENKGSTSNFEYGLKKASGDIIFLSDQDDIWLENKFDTCIKWLEKFDVVVTDCKVVNADLHVLHESYFNFRKSGKGVFKNLIKNSYLGCCMAFKRSVLQIAIPFPPDIAKSYVHDTWIGFVSECFFSSYFINTPLLLFRRHQYSLSSAGNKSPFSFRQKFDFRWKVVKYFPLLLVRYSNFWFSKQSFPKVLKNLFSTLLS